MVSHDRLHVASHLRQRRRRYGLFGAHNRSDPRHEKLGVTQGHIHIEERLREAADRVSAKIAELLDGRASSVWDDQAISVEEPLAA